MEGFILACSRTQSFQVGSPGRESEAVGQEAEEGEGWCQLLSLLILVPGTVPSTFRVDLPSAVEPFWKHRQRHTGR